MVTKTKGNIYNFISRHRDAVILERVSNQRVQSQAESRRSLFRICRSWISSPNIKTINKFDLNGTSNFVKKKK